MKKHSVMPHVGKFLILMSLLWPGMAAYAVDDGAYAGFYQVTFADPEARRELGDSGEMILVVKDNKTLSTFMVLLVPKVSSSLT